MLQLHSGRQISSMEVLSLRRNSRNGQVKLDQIFLSSFHMELPIVPGEVRYVLLRVFAPSGILLLFKSLFCISSLILINFGVGGCKHDVAYFAEY